MQDNDAKKIYYKAWRERNKEKIKQYQIRYWERKSKEVK